MNNMDVFNDINTHFETLGEFIRYHREKKQFSLEELSMKTKIRIQQLVNLEQNNFPELPNPVYLKGFIKTICNELDANVELALKFLNQNTIAEEALEFLTPGKEIKPLHFNFKFFDKSRIKINRKLFVLSVVGIILGGSFISNIKLSTRKAEPTIAHKRMNIFEAQKLVQHDAVTDLTPPEGLGPITERIIPEGEALSPKKMILNNDIIEGKKVIPDTVSAASIVTPAAPPVVQAPIQTKTTVPNIKKITVKASKGTAFLAYRVNGEKKNKIYLKHGKTLELEGHEIRMDVGNPGGVEFTKNGEPVEVKLEPGHASLHLTF